MCLGKVGVVSETWEDAGVPMATIEVDSSVQTACLLIHPEVKPGTPVVLHVGYVVEVLDDESSTGLVSPQPPDHKEGEEP